jgi:hypothetical protein
MRTDTHVWSARLPARRHTALLSRRVNYLSAHLRIERSLLESLLRQATVLDLVIMLSCQVLVLGLQIQQNLPQRTISKVESDWVISKYVITIDTLPILDGSIAVIPNFDHLIAVDLPELFVLLDGDLRLSHAKRDLQTVLLRLRLGLEVHQLLTHELRTDRLLVVEDVTLAVELSDATANFRSVLDLLVLHVVDVKQGSLVNV